MITESDASPFQQMDSMYRYQRYIYDATRKFYLIGRDTLLATMKIGPGQNIAEIGCGTGRNLAILAERYPQTSFFGLDASAEMLRTAEARIAKADLRNVKFCTALAEDLDHRESFGLDKPLDIIFFSYSITMIPLWRESIERAVANLQPDGRLYIVDFYDQRDLPQAFRFVLKNWLRQFHVQFWSDLMPFLFALQKSGVGTMEIRAIARRYAFIAEFEKGTHV